MGDFPAEGTLYAQPSRSVALLVVASGDPVLAPARIDDSLLPYGYPGAHDVVSEQRFLLMNLARWRCNEAFRGRHAM